jgi:deoxyribonuclease V
VCVDVDYRDDGARAALVAFNDWRDEAIAGERVELIRDVAPYEPGQFYKRELPCLLRVLDGLDPRVIIVDGYAWLAADRPGLGVHLHRALGGRVPVIGVSKTEFAGADTAIPLFRRGSVRPLYVTAEGIDLREAFECVQAMHGSHRLPAMLSRVDRLCRDAP